MVWLSKLNLNSELNLSARNKHTHRDMQESGVSFVAFGRLEDRTLLYHFCFEEKYEVNTHQASR